MLSISLDSKSAFILDGSTSIFAGFALLRGVKEPKSVSKALRTCTHSTCYFRNLLDKINSAS